MPRTEITAIYTAPANHPIEIIPQPIDGINGMEQANGTSRFAFVIYNDGTGDLTVVAKRRACPVCADTDDPIGQGEIVIPEKGYGYIGPLDPELYGYGTEGNSVYLDFSTGGTIGGYLFSLALAG